MRQHPALVDPRRWRLLRRRILERDGWRCRACGRAAGRFEVDHVQSIHAGGEWWDESNLQLLCRPCHFRKSAAEIANPLPPDVAAWREFLRT